MSAFPFLLIIAVSAGAISGFCVPEFSEQLGKLVDLTLLALVGLLFFGLRFRALVKTTTYLRFIGIVLFANFVVIPFLGYGIASMFLSAHPLFMVGLVIYFMSPCTDWFLGFTRLARGNVALGATLIPINMIVQILLYPVFLKWFTLNTVQVETGTIINSLVHWFFLPLILALTAHQTLRWALRPSLFNQLQTKADQTIPWMTALLVFQIFADNISVILENPSAFVMVLFAVFAFFLATYLLSEGLSYLFKLPYKEHALLTMTIAARNAPLMLAITMVALPNQPLIYTALVIGMLVEFPHLAALRQILVSVEDRHQNELIKYRV